MDYFLDTNIVLVYIRKSDLYKQLDKQLNLIAGDNNLIVSIVTIGELKSIAKSNNWGDKKLDKLTEFLKQFLIADINVESVVERYAEIDAYSQGKLKDEVINFSARNMGKNDLWIAATASILNATLITTDNDFAHLDDKYLKLIKVDLDKL